LIRGGGLVSGGGDGRREKTIRARERKIERQVSSPAVLSVPTSQPLFTSFTIISP
jgi:hypothetical protein